MSGEIHDGHLDEPDGIERRHDASVRGVQVFTEPSPTTFYCNYCRGSGVVHPTLGLIMSCSKCQERVRIRDERNAH